MDNVFNPPWAGTAEPCLPPHLSRPLLRPEDAAELIALLTGTPITPRALACMRTRGTGPRFRKVRARWVVYAPADIAEWCAAAVSDAVTSTSEVRS